MSNNISKMSLQELVTKATRGLGCENFKKYSAIRRMVEDKRIELKKGLVLSYSKDRLLLENLFLGQHNGIASVGQSFVHIKGGQESIIRAWSNQYFINALKDYILDSDNPSKFDALRKSFSTHIGGSENSAIIHRVAAACTSTVSTEVVKDKFDNVMRMIQEIVSDEPFSHKINEVLQKRDWFRKNQEFIRQLDDIPLKTDEGKPLKEDLYRKCDFLWVIETGLHRKN